MNQCRREGLRNISIEVNPLMKKGVFLALLLMLLAVFPALAEDVYYADASV